MILSPFPCLTKNLHILFLFLCSIFTVHVPNWVIVVLLYIFNCIFTIFVAANCSLVILGNNFLYMCNGVMLNHYLCLLYMVLLYYFCLAMFLSLLLLPSSFYENELNLYSPSQCCFLLHCLGLFLAPPHSHPGPFAPTHPFEAANLPTFFSFLSICQALSLGMTGSAVLTCLFCRHFLSVPMAFLDYLYMLSLGLFHLSNSFVSVKLFIMVDWASTLWAQHNTFSLVFPVFL